MCDVDGLTNGSDCFAVGHTIGRDGMTLAAMWAYLSDEAPDLADWQRNALEGGWHAGQADREAAEAHRAWREEMNDAAAAERMAVPQGDEIPF